MMIIFFTNNKKYNNRKAITFVELMVCIIVASLVFKVVFDFMSNTRHNYMYGVVNLQNLQDARFAINCLRRDFASSCPMFKVIVPDDKEKSPDYENVPAFRRELFATPGAQGIPNSENLIQVSEDKHDLVFYKFVYISEDEYPRVEKVMYQYDGSDKLVRTSETKGQTVFKGFKDVEFALYTHQINPAVPLLWVKLKVHESSNMYGSEKIGEELELTTTISSDFINSSINNKYWRFETGFKPLE